MILPPRIIERQPSIAAANGEEPASAGRTIVALAARSAI
jgi:hypothetical protein